MISRLLVANRGEIARRVFRTCRQAGIGCVAVCSDPDSAAPHVAEADLAVALPGASPAQTYLNGDAIIAAAIAAGADAIHPGYGFLSEDAGFARSVRSAGLTWIGPPPEAIEAMGSKIISKKLAERAGLPVLPELDPGALTEFPALVKASAGGGGRGMRVVRTAAELPSALAAAQREARAAFGDGTVFCEPLLAGARHVEVQVLADSRGSVWALTERDCSLQRRYQKVIEETPSPAVSPPLRERLLAAAEAITRAVGYLGAGTAEFLVAGDGRFFFLEFNTRLQVEHPVTECIHDIDLVALQLDIACGGALPQAPAATGHAIEARLYAEDPADGYRPASGTVHAFAIPDVDARFTVPAGRRSPGLRLDSGIEAGTEVSPYYDAMLAKLIAWAPSRDAAARRLAATLALARIHGPATNRDLLVSLLRQPAFLAGEADTSFLDGYEVAGLAPGEQACRLSALAAALAAAAANRSAARTVSAGLGGWRNVVSQPQRTSYDSAGGRIGIAYRWTRDGIEAVPTPDGSAGGPALPDGSAGGSGLPDGSAGGPALPDGSAGGPGLPVVVAFGPEQVTLDVSGVRHRFDVARAGDAVWVDSAFGMVRLTPVQRLPEPVPQREPGSLIAPMPGSVVRVEAAPGDTVTAGQSVLVLEAMKMEHLIVAPVGGLIAELCVTPGDQVAAGDVLAVVSASQQAAQA
jgi:propionyl-CoA carboxylase alpha chain